MNGCNITAGQQDYAERLNQIESQKEDYYRELGIAPGIPTMKGSYGDPENTGVGYNTIIRNLGDHSVPAEWAEYVKKNENKDTAPGAPIAWESPSQPEDVQPGYGYVADNNESEETFYYHSDHLGSTSYVTDDSARITQYTAYLPYGELLVDEHSSSEDMPYKFNGKELDEETGLYYYGARYMQPITSVWYGVDPLTEKYPDVSAYTYCMGNPVKLVDDDGRKVIFINGKIGGGSPAAGSQYWNGVNSTFVQRAKKFFNDRNVSFTNRDYGYLSSASQRRKEGYEYAKSAYPDWISSMQPDESFKLVSHSMGGAFSMGIEDYIKEQGQTVDYNVMINTYQVDKINIDKSSNTFYIDYQNTNDPVLFWFDINLGYGELENSDMIIREKSSEDLFYIHRSPIDTGDFWKTIKDNMKK